MLNLEWFRTFKAIYETGNLTAAAQSLFISQPGVSIHLNSLETYTGYPLFERKTRRMQPTERGRILYNCIIDPMNKLVEAEESFYRNSKECKSTISIGMAPEAFEYTLAEHIAQLSFNLVVRFGEHPQMLQDLDSGVLDLILTSHKLPQANLEYTPFTKERIILICGSQTDTTELDEMIFNNSANLMEWLKQQVWYTTAADMEHLRKFWLANFDCLPDFKPNYIVPHFGYILRCLRNGTGFSVVPDFLCKGELRDATVKLAWEGNSPVENMLYFGKRKKTKYAAEIRQLEDMLTHSWTE